MRLFRLASLVLCICFVSTGYSQHVSPDSIVICAGSPRVFLEEQSRSAGKTIEWEWHFGDTTDGKQNVSFEETPVHTYSRPGSYAVHLIRTNDAQEKDTFIMPVRVFPVPEVELSVPQICAGIPSILTGNSLNVDSDSLTWKWEFGDSNVPRYIGAKANHTYRKAGTYSLRLKVFSHPVCATEVSRKIEVYEVPSPVGVLTDTVCFGERAKLKLAPRDSLETHWFESAEGKMSLQIGESFLTPPLPYKAVFFAAHKSTNGCYSPRIPVPVMVISSETIRLTTEPESPLPWPQNQVRVGVSGGIDLDKVLWKFGDGDTSTSLQATHIYANPGTYQVKAYIRTGRGCSLEVANQLSVSPPPPVFLPAAFSPNKDGINDLFQVESHNMESCSIQIFNSVGEAVFVGDTPDFSWDGSGLNGKPVPEAIYMYQIKGADKSGKLFEKEGTVTLVR